MTQDLEVLAEAIRRKSGMTVGAARMPALAAAVVRVAPQLKGSGLARAACDDVLLDRLVDELSVNETFFFRHPRDLEAVDWTRLREVAVAAGRREIRVWSAGCASGEEPYTLAILACEAFGTATPPLTILGTDVSATALDRAREGIYRGRSVAGIAPALCDRYLRREPGGHRVDERIRALVYFRRHNLPHDPALPPGEVHFDLILCRNVLIYLVPQAVESAIASLENALEPGGMLILGTADRL
ncbi:MAG TPA: protein-glutamate O-methyltransferase CheR, partial [Solirubrobacteraceae bacterium]